MKSKTILLRLPNWIGDLVMATPTLRALRISFPQARIVALGKPWARELLAEHPAVDEVIAYPFQKKSQGLGARFQLIKAIKERLPDWGLLFPNSLSSALLFYMAGIPQRVGYITGGRGAFLNHGLEPPLSPPPLVDYYLGLMKGFSLEKDWEREFFLPLSEDAKKKAHELWNDLGVKPGEPVVGLNPGAAWGASKRWLPERFAEVGDLFAREGGAKITLFGSPEEIPLAQKIALGMKQPPLILAGKDNLKILPALLSRCNLFITNDTGPMHIAASQGVPLVVIFGPTDPRQTAHYLGGIKIISKELQCAPCFKRECPYKHHECMVGITAAEVFAAGAELLKKAKEKA